MPTKELTIEEKMQKVIQAQKTADRAYEAIEQDFPEAWQRLERIRITREKADELKAEIRQDLIQAGDYNVHKIEGHNISVTRIVKLEVADSDEVPMDFKTPTKEKWDVDVKKAVEDAKMMGIVPDGFKDKSTYKLNWNPIKNA